MKIYNKSGNLIFDGPMANLTGADLTGADLRDASLAHANLTGADLFRANLTRANLVGANLVGADLTDANLTRANLVGADLFRANLVRADLFRANLVRANLAGADLTNTILDPNAPIPKLIRKELEQAGFIVKHAHRGPARVYGWRTKHSQHCGDTEYEPGKCYTAPVFSVSQETGCHPGIYLASREWLQKSYSECEYVQCYCLINELIHAGDKWRAKRIWVVK